MYEIVVDMMRPGIYYVYKDTDFTREVKLTIHHDYDLAKRIVDILNKEEKK